MITALVTDRGGEYRAAAKWEPTITAAIPPRELRLACLRLAVLLRRSPQPEGTTT